MVYNRSWHIPGNPRLVMHPARLIEEWGCVDLSMVTLHLKYPLVLFGYEGSALSLPLLLSPRRIMLCQFFNYDKGPLFASICGAGWPLCVDVPLNTYSFIHFVIYMLDEYCSVLCWSLLY